MTDKIGMIDKVTLLHAEQELEKRVRQYLRAEGSRVAVDTPQVIASGPKFAKLEANGFAMNVYPALNETEMANVLMRYDAEGFDVKDIDMLPDGVYFMTIDELGLHYAKIQK